MYVPFRQNYYYSVVVLPLNCQEKMQKIRIFLKMKNIIIWSKYGMNGGAVMQEYSNEEYPETISMEEYLNKRKKVREEQPIESYSLVSEESLFPLFVNR